MRLQSLKKVMMIMLTQTINPNPCPICRLLKQSFDSSSEMVLCKSHKRAISDEYVIALEVSNDDTSPELNMNTAKTSGKTMYIKRKNIQGMFNEDISDSVHLIFVNKESFKIH